MTAMSLDVTDADAIAAFAKDVVAKHPDLNILVNNAGIMGAEDASAKRDLSHAEATVITNILGPIRLTDALVDHLAAQADSAIDRKSVVEGKSVSGRVDLGGRGNI